MCLLDEVLNWDAGSIRCASESHRDETNPMRSHDGLHALCAIEYAAQAMAVHGALAGSVDGKPRSGYLVSLRNVLCRERYLHQFGGPLIIDAERVVGEAERVMYTFSVCSGTVQILTGRATVVLDVR